MTAAHQREQPTVDVERADGAGYLVAAADTIFHVSSETDGVLRPATAGAANPLSGFKGDTPRQAAAGTSGWNVVANDCFARYSDTWTWMDHCYQDLKLSNDGSSTYDYYTLHHYATVHPNSPWVANSGLINAQAATSQTWMDWSPRGDRNGNCISASISVSVGGVGASYPVEKCELWDMNKDNPAVNYALLWYGPGCRQDRELAYEIAVRVSQGAWPQWYLGGESHGSAF